jgi:hypothetical protein
VTDAVDLSEYEQTVHDLVAQLERLRTVHDAFAAATGLLVETRGTLHQEAERARALADAATRAVERLAESDPDLIVQRIDAAEANVAKDLAARTAVMQITLGEAIRQQGGESKQEFASLQAGLEEVVSAVRTDGAATRSTASAVEAELNHVAWAIDEGKQSAIARFDRIDAAAVRQDEAITGLTDVVTAAKADIVDRVDRRSGEASLILGDLAARLSALSDGLTRAASGIDAIKRQQATFATRLEGFGRDLGSLQEMVGEHRRSDEAAFAAVVQRVDENHRAVERRVQAWGRLGWLTAILTTVAVLGVLFLARRIGLF